MTGILINIILCIGLLTGIFCTLITLPGNLLIVVVSLGYAVYDGFVHVTYQTLTIIIALFLAGELAEFIASALGAKRQKASTRAAVAAVIGSVLGGIAGTVLLPVVGSVIGAVTGAFAASYAAEYSKTNDADQARRVGISVMKGQAVGMIFKVVIAVSMAVLIIAKLPWSG